MRTLLAMALAFTVVGAMPSLAQDNLGKGETEQIAEEAFIFDVLGYSLGGMIAQQMAQDRPSVFRRIILVGTAPRGGEDIMHLEKPSLAEHFGDPNLKGYAILQKIFFTPSRVRSRSLSA